MLRLFSVSSLKELIHSNPKTISSGIKQLDQILGDGIFIGDNVVCYDEVGSLAPVFYLNLMKASQNKKTTHLSQL